MAKRGEMPMDLSTLDTSRTSQEGARLELLHPAENTRLGVFITLAGIDSDIYRKTSNRIANKRVQRLRPGQPFIPLTAEEQEENGLELLASCTLGWEGMFVDGQPLEFSKENVKALYRRFGWIREQVDGFIADRANFLAR